MDIVNGAPLVKFLGTKDLTAKLELVPEEEIPQFLAKMFVFAEKGPTSPVWLKGNGLSTIFGSDSVDKISPFYTHQTSYLLRELKRSSAMVQRVIPADAEKAKVTIFAVVKEDDYATNKRYSTGKFLMPLDATGDTKAGIRIGFASSDDVSGNILTIDASTKAYPLFTLYAAYEGKYYNNIGFSVSPVSPTSVGRAYFDKEKGYIPMKFSLYETDGSKAKKIPTLMGSDGVIGTTYENVRNPMTRNMATIGETFQDSFYNTTDTKKPFRYEYTDDLVVYSDHIDTINDLIISKETPDVTDAVQTWEDGKDAATSSWFDYSGVPDATMTKLVNLFTCKSVTGVPYMNCAIDVLGTEVDASSLGGVVNFGDNSPIFMIGGTDGTINTTTYDEAVVGQLRRYADPYDPVLDLAYNVESTVVDTGFKMDVKFEFCNVWAIRPDMNIIWSTVDAVVDRLRPQTYDEMAVVARTILTRANLYPESTYFGTSVMRATIVGGNGKLVDGSHSGYLSQNYALFGKCVDYMGAGNGKWKPEFRFDRAPGNIIKDMYKLSPADIPDIVKPALWEAQLIWSGRYNRSLYHFPQTQTIHEDDSSTLNGILVMSAISTLVKIGAAVQREFTGSQRLKRRQLGDRAVAFVNKRIEGIFDDTFTITPTVTFTDLDINAGYRWTLDIAIDGPHMMTVESFSITATSIEDI
jgi:hypothetical protein